jgi:hypothetical protein
MEKKYFFNEETEQKNPWIEFGNSSVDKITSTWKDTVTIKNNSKENISLIETRNQLTSTQKVALGAGILVTVVVSIILISRR